MTNYQQWKKFTILYKIKPLWITEGTEVINLVSMCKYIFVQNGRTDFIYFMNNQFHTAYHHLIVHGHLSQPFDKTFHDQAIITANEQVYFS